SALGFLTRALDLMLPRFTRMTQSLQLRADPSPPRRLRRSPVDRSGAASLTADAAARRMGDDIQEAPYPQGRSILVGDAPTSARGESRVDRQLPSALRCSMTHSAAG